jgi:hypothetical protein
MNEEIKKYNSEKVKRLGEDYTFYFAPPYLYFRAKELKMIDKIPGFILFSETLTTN